MSEDLRDMVTGATTYTLKTQDRDEAMRAIHANELSRFIDAWENLMRQARKYDTGDLYGVDINTIEEIWFKLKDEFELGYIA